MCRSTEYFREVKSYGSFTCLERFPSSKSAMLPSMKAFSPDSYMNCELLSSYRAYESGLTFLFYLVGVLKLYNISSLTATVTQH